MAPLVQQSISALTAWLKKEAASGWLYDPRAWTLRSNGDLLDFVPVNDAPYGLAYRQLA